jgi:hypothetical protein
MKIFKTKKYGILVNILKYSFIAVFALFLLAQTAFADPTTGGGGPTTGGGTTVTTTINNPLGTNGPQNIPDFIQAIIKIVLIVGVPVVVLAIIYTGFLFVKAQGNPEEITKAKKSLLYTLIGAALLLGAFVIANAIGATVKDIGSGV